MTGPDTHSFRSAMSRLGAAVNIITTDGPAGRQGLTASAVCSVTDSPPTLLVCINRKARAHDAFLANGALCVNVLAPRHQDLAARFGAPGLTPEDRFTGAEWLCLMTGAPALAGASTSLDCRIVQARPVGTHSVLFCEVQQIASTADAEGLVYFDRRYHPLGAPSAAHAL